MHDTQSGPAVLPGPGSPHPSVQRGAYFALAVLFSMNLLNYMDRYVFFAVGNLIQHDLHIKDRGFGLLSTSFMVVYTIISPVMGWLGDRYSRKRLVAFGVALWSVATVGTAFSRDFSHMFFWRALLGVGEASYGVIAPALLSDLFPPRYRGRVMGLYFLALPLGGALGYGIGGSVGDLLGWQAAFWIVGVPGVVAAVAGMAIRDPGRGASEGGGPGQADRPRFADYLAIFKTRSFLYNTAGMAAVTFATGAYAVWGSTFYQRVHGLKPAQAGPYIGGLIAAAGLLGIVLGSWVADFLLKFTRRAYLLWAALAVAVAVPFGLAGILDPEWRSSMGLLFAAMILLASVLGPSNTVTADVVPANKRAAGFALNIFLIHLLGDIFSPVLIGFLSDLFSRPSVVESVAGRAFAAIGATPVSTTTGPTNLAVGMLSVVPVLVLGAVFFLAGSRHLPTDQDRARRASGPAAGDGSTAP
jgi:MFS transporter, Spinster family, sphingosine-1-phosphate transporter